MNIDLNPMKLLSRDPASGLTEHYPVKVLQIGEGNFLRGFFDWMIHECNKLGNFQGSIAVTQPRPSGREKIEKLKKQDGLYTLMVRGLQEGQKIEQNEIISVFSKAIDPYTEWAEFLDLSKMATLEFVVSNTTEAGIHYRQIPWEEGVPIESFPGRLTAFLYKRYQHFHGDPEKGLIMLPCELLEKNGDVLKHCVRQHIKDWGLPKSFADWVEQHNQFLNSLVDRIVTGFPEKEAEALFEKWGYKDHLLNTAEPYHFWAIEGEPDLDKRLPFKQSGLNVHWVEDLAPYQIRKVRILNGSHTIMAPLGILSGLETVGEVMDHSDFNDFLCQAINKEIIPSLPYDSGELTKYAESVLERFRNPFVHHRLSDISLNTISKFKVRLLPTLEAFAEKEGRLPVHVLRAFAGLIRFCRVKKIKGSYAGKRFNGEPYIVKDDEQKLSFFSEQWMCYENNKISLHEMTETILANQELWDKDLNKINGLAGALCDQLHDLR
ncbi:tagaturonate reductase [Cytobacillus firmus]|uniref:tagaturonate reductase n=1 Tax=Cytobacillus firmus TaxID=1399 RepID=UPI001C8DD1F5|nr:tagaturonate reductase [Cytobacillus firmus]MBX9971568.1 tagaturonate reductase [Cytobacillus firmus]